MKIGFYNTYSEGSEMHLVMGDMMIRSAKRMMPGVEIVQFTDETSPTLWGIDRVQRLPGGPLALRTPQHYSKCDDGDWLFVDTDVIFQRDVRDVFDDEDFDIAVCTRANTLVDGEAEIDFIKKNPYNIGVVFSRCAAFWAEVAELVSQDSLRVQGWMGNQKKAAIVIASGKYRVKVLDATYNYPPKNADEDVSGQAVLHYKGPIRKAWMLARFYQA